MNFSALHRRVDVKNALFLVCAALALSFSLPSLGPWWLFPLGLCFLYGAFCHQGWKRAGVATFAAFVFGVYGAVAAFPFFTSLWALFVSLSFALLGVIAVLLYREARSGKIFTDSFFFGAVIALMEFVRTAMLGGEGLGNGYATLARIDIVAPFFRYVGVFGVSAFLGMIAAMVAQLCWNRKFQKHQDAIHGSALRFMLMVVVFGAAILFHPSVFTHTETQTVRVAVIGHTRDTQESSSGVEDEYTQGIRSALARGADVVLLPQHALGFDTKAAFSKFLINMALLQKAQPEAVVIFGVAGSGESVVCRGGHCGNTSMVEFLRQGKSIGSANILTETWEAYPPRTPATSILRLKDDQRTTTLYGEEMSFTEDLAHARMLNIPMFRATKGGISAIVFREGELGSQTNGTELLISDVRF